MLSNNEDDTFIELSNLRKHIMNVIPLEKLSIPHFKGDPKQFMRFCNLFETVVNNNASLQSVDKFTYLKSYLEGEPLSLINNLMLSDENYVLALNILHKRYSNPCVISESYFFINYEK